MSPGASRASRIRRGRAHTLLPGLQRHLRSWAQDPRYCEHSFKVTSLTLTCTSLFTGTCGSVGPTWLGQDKLPSWDPVNHICDLTPTYT